MELKSKTDERKFVLVRVEPEEHAQLEKLKAHFGSRAGVATVIMAIVRKALDEGITIKRQAGANGEARTS